VSSLFRRPRLTQTYSLSLPYAKQNKKMNGLQGILYLFSGGAFKVILMNETWC